MSSEATPNSLEQQNKNTVAAFMEVFSNGDIEAILSYLSDTATWWVGGTVEGVSGTKNKKEFADMLANLSAMTETSAIKLTPKEWTAEGNRVAVETESYSELKNGRVYNNLYHFAFEIQEGWIESVKEFLDTEHTRAVFVTP